MMNGSVEGRLGPGDPFYDEWMAIDPKLENIADVIDYSGDFPPLNVAAPDARTAENSFSAGLPQRDNINVLGNEIITKKEFDAESNRRHAPTKDDFRSKRESQVTSGPSRRARAGKKKPKGMPKRPLSAYNIFFQKERPKVYEAYDQKVTFEELGKEIGLRWRSLNEQDRKQYEALAEKEVERYRKERDAFEEARRKRIDGRLSDRGLSAPDAVVTSDRYAVAPAAKPVCDTSGYDQSQGSHRPWYQPGAPRDDSVSRGGSEERSSDSYGSSYRREEESPSSPPSYSVHPAEAAPPAEPLSSPPGVSYEVHRRRFNQMPVPPGMQLVLPDETGRDETYTVHYTCYRMSKSEADAYIRSLTTKPSSYGAPPPRGSH